MQLFTDAATRVKDRFSEYSEANFSVVLQTLFERIKVSDLTKPARSHIDAYNALAKALKQSFSL